MGKPVVDIPVVEKKIKAEWIGVSFGILVQMVIVVYSFSQLYYNVESNDKEIEKLITKVEHLESKKLNDSPSIIRLEKDLFYLMKNYEEHEINKHKNKKEK